MRVADIAIRMTKKSNIIIVIDKKTQRVYFSGEASELKCISWTNYKSVVAISISENTIILETR